MRKDRVIQVLALIGVVIVVISIVWVNRPLPPSGGEEIREYNGQKLSSINDYLEVSIDGTPPIDKASYRLEVVGLGNNTVEYTYDDVITRFQHEEKVVTLYCVLGWNATLLWEGVRVEDLLKEVGVDPEAKAVVFYAPDGFWTALPLDHIRENDIIIAYKINGLVLQPGKGFPFHLVAENKWGLKWAKWITKIELSKDASYKGYYGDLPDDENLPPELLK